MNYFELFGIPVSFNPNLQELKKKYYKLSFTHHPDHQADQENALEKSSELNKAYNTLINENARFAYILTLHDAMPDEGKAQLPQDFLMEMMDLNENLMDLQMDPDQDKIKSLKNEVEQIESTLKKEIESIIRSYDPNTISNEEMKALVDYYMKHKYLLRIKQNLLTFANT